MACSNGGAAFCFQSQFLSLFQRLLKKYSRCFSSIEWKTLNQKIQATVIQYFYSAPLFLFNCNLKGSDLLRAQLQLFLFCIMLNAFNLLFSHKEAKKNCSLLLENTSFSTASPGIQEFSLSGLFSCPLVLKFLLKSQKRKWHDDIQHVSIHSSGTLAWEHECYYFFLFIII